MTEKELKNQFIQLLQEFDLINGVYIFKSTIPIDIAIDICFFKYLGCCSQIRVNVYTKKEIRTK